MKFRLNSEPLRKLPLIRLRTPLEYKENRQTWCYLSKYLKTLELD